MTMRTVTEETPRAEANEAQTAAQTGAHPVSRDTRWGVGLVSLGFILLQSACTWVMAVSGVRVAIGLGALAAAAGLHRPSSGFHADLFRVPMMIVAVGGSLAVLYVIWRMRSLRARPASAWRVAPVTAKQRRQENWQIALAVATLALVAAEWATHLIVHGV